MPAGVLPPLNLNIADGAILRDRRANVVLAQSSTRVANVICFGIVGVIGFVLLGLFLYDRARRELLYLSIACIAVALIYINWFRAAALADYSVFAYIVLWATPAFAGNIARTLFFFRLAGRRVPLLFWILIGIGDSLYLVVMASALLPPRQALWLDAARVHRIEAVCTMALVAVGVAPFVAFFPYSRVSQRMRPLAGLSMAWGFTMVLFFFVRMTAFHIPGLPNLQKQWGGTVANAEGVSTLCLLAALLGLLFREQQQHAQERALLAGEMQAARSVQSQLVPETAPNTPGFTVESVYLPASEVGGDFFQIQPADDGSLLIVVGDVSGKGLKAAMTVSTIMGALRNDPSRQPAEILDHLNRVLHGQIKGFATCCAVLIAPDGAMAIANAGHIPPYRNGDELAVSSALPLGVLADASYSETRTPLALGDRLTFVSDGVAEATNAKRELFGFERTQRMSNQSAAAIAEAAQSFGQEDDITVVGIQFVGAETLASTST
jgi:Stage II sporulation protein E (SpoIIE)